MKQKYSFNSELKKYAFLNPPVVIKALPFIEKSMKVLYLTQQTDKNLKVERFKIDVDFMSKINALLYTPKNCGEKSPLIVFYHGGGFAYEAAPHHFVMARRLALELEAKVLFVSYRLAPKYKFPTAVYDAFAAYEWALDNAEKLGVNTEKIALCGDSAGGNLSVAVSILAKEKKIKMPCAQVLIYPFVDMSSDSESMTKFTDTPMCNSKAAVKYNEVYLPKEKKIKMPCAQVLIYPFVDMSSDSGSMIKFTDTPMCNSKAAEKYNEVYVCEGAVEKIELLSPVDAPSLEDMPETYIELAEFDCLHDGGRKFADRLINEGVKTEVVETVSTMHGYDFASGSSFVRNITDKRVAFLKNIFKR